MLWSFQKDRFFFENVTLYAFAYTAERTWESKIHLLTSSLSLIGLNRRATNTLGQHKQDTTCRCFSRKETSLVTDSHSRVPLKVVFSLALISVVSIVTLL